MIKTSDEGTSYCTLCEGYARKLEIAREALKNIKKHCELVCPTGAHLTGTFRIANDALSRMEGKEKS